MTEPSSPSAAERIDALEIRIAYQDETIETLNKAITDQWQTIDMLRRQMARLQERLEAAEMKSAGPAAPEPPPPHY